MPQTAPGPDTPSPVDAETTTDPLHVAHVVLSLDVGGLEHIVLDLAGEGRRLGQRVSVVCLERRGTLAARAEAAGAAVVCVDKRPGVRPGTVARLAAAFRLLRADVVHTHQIGALFYAGPAARRGGTPVVHTEHGKHYGRRLRTALLARVAAWHARRFVCVSRDIADAAVAHRVAPAAKVRVVANGIDTRRFSAGGDAAAVRASLGLPPGAPVVGTIGRLDEVKRQDVLIRGFARARERVPDAQLVVVGDGPLRAELTGLAESLGLGGVVHFAGYQPSPERYLRAMDVFALSSRSEGMPLSVLEAWAAGVPVVASRVGGLPEMIGEDRYGLLFDAGDEAALAEALRALLLDPAAARRLSEAARGRVEAEFSLTRMASAYQSLYREAVGATRPRSAGSCAAGCG